MSIDIFNEIKRFKNQDILDSYWSNNVNIPKTNEYITTPIKNNNNKKLIKKRCQIHYHN